MDKEKSKIFLCYAREDMGMAKQLYNDLKRYGLDVWLDTESLLSGQDWRFEIHKAIKDSNFFIPLLSSKSITKIGEVERELKIAFDTLERYPKSEIYLLPVRLEKCEPIEEKLSELHWIDVFPPGKYQNGLKKILQVVCKEALLLRSKPKALTEGDAAEMIRKFGFYDEHKNPRGKGFSHQYQLQGINGDKVVVAEFSLLMWQQSGSDDSMNFDEAKQWVRELNRNGFAGFADWRLPTLEEAMSLMEPEEKNGLFINPIFDGVQEWIWTADREPGESLEWIVGFSDGSCGYDGFNVSYSVRAVRSGESDRSD